MLNHAQTRFILSSSVLAQPSAPTVKGVVSSNCTRVPVAEQIKLGKTNFGVLGVRVAKSISAHFGGGQISSSEGCRGEAAIFGQFASWIDYSGPVGGNKAAVTEGITS